jgi:hypothetical protein
MGSTCAQHGTAQHKTSAENLPLPNSPASVQSKKEGCAAGQVQVLQI